MSHTFHTLAREHQFRNPSPSGLDVPILNELVAPHIESFNALFDDSGLAHGDGDGRGLLSVAIQDIGERVVHDGKGVVGEPSGWGNKLTIWLDGLAISRPMVPDKDKSALERRVFPSEARERLTSYRGRMSVKINWRVGANPVVSMTRDCGLIPVMVRSVRCNLRGMGSAALVAKHEESTEFGGYFIVNGIERLIRYLILPRRNSVIGLSRPSFAERGVSYTQYAVQIRCARADQTSVTNTLHYLSNGNATLRFSWRKQEYMIPVMVVLKALTGASDKEIFEGLVMEDYNNTFMTDRVELLLRSFKTFNLPTREQCLEYLGSKFRVVLGMPEHRTNRDLGMWLLNKTVLVHLDSPRDKFRLLLFMLRKVYSLASGSCCPDNPDSVQHQEILLPGSLYGMIIKERLEEVLNKIRSQIAQDVRNDVPSVDFMNNSYIKKVLQKVNFDIGVKMSHFLATGNLVSPSGLDLQQTSGFTLVAEKLNWQRYISHFRCVHRGAFFANLKTTTVRKLRPEAWGFLCPVHTPDGAPCGLLNHLTRTCRIVTAPLAVSHIPSLLLSQGMTQAFAPSVDGRRNLCVQLDGRVIGWAASSVCKQLAKDLRVWKTEGINNIPLDLEIGFVPVSRGGQYPGLYLFSSKARMMRPVMYLENNRNDSIGSFEQVYLDIAVKPEEIEKGVSTHVEHAATNFMSILANMTPFSDFNQVACAIMINGGPSAESQRVARVPATFISAKLVWRHIISDNRIDLAFLQMGKQTMGTPATALRHRTDNKLYKLQTGQTPVVRPELHNAYGMDHFPSGTNAVVAVISYTGYDMEDAMIINKSSLERGFAYGTVYKGQIVDLKDIKGASRSASAPTLHFGLGPGKVHGFADSRDVRKFLDGDGLPIIGSRLYPGDPICAHVEDTTGFTHVTKYKGDEVAYVDQVRLLGSDAGDTELQKIHVTLRIPRPPVIGDKFSSRHGQKGVLSQKWPAIDMPFSESGMQPDVIINPHAFPSRMTIGMLVESMAGKAGSMHGLAQDATPFRFSEEDTAIDYFGEQLLAAGYNYYGNEPMYSGITGEEFAADIYLGVVYYQRLRHMVLDKFQVRTTGPVDPVTRQPVKGRKRAGGIRFGEMERDALIAHGTSYLLHDRLLNCSDYSTAWVCRTCGSLISLGYEDVTLGEDLFGSSDAEPKSTGPSGEYCRVCREKAEEADVYARQALAGTQLHDRNADLRVSIPHQNLFSTGRGDMDVVALPYVFRYLCAELAAMSIAVSLEVT